MQRLPPEKLTDSSSLLHQPNDSGSYTCIATNAVGKDSRTMILSVHTHPVFTELLRDVALNKGDRLMLACGVSGIPPPKITWALNNNIIPGNKEYDLFVDLYMYNGYFSYIFPLLNCVFLLFYMFIVHYDHMNGYSELVIERASKDDSGTYTCVAENSVGTIKSVGFVYVKGKTTQIKVQLLFFGP